MGRKKEADRRQLIDVLMEIQKEDSMELEKVKEGMVYISEKTKFGRKFAKDMESMNSVDEVMDTEALLIGEILISLKISTISLTFQLYSSQKARGRPSGGGRETPCYRGR